MGFKHYSENEKNIIIENFKNGKSTVEISELLNKSSSGIERFLKKNNLYERKVYRNITSEDIILIKKMYIEDQLSTVEIMNIFKPKIKSDALVARILREQGVKIRLKNQSIIKNENFFEVIDTEEKAYFLGLLISDGSIGDTTVKNNRQRTISITLKAEDSYMIEHFKNILGLKRKLVFSRNECTISTSSDKMASDLLKYGVIPRKTNKTFLPKLNEDLMPHLIRGIFDGDGTVFISKNRLRFGFYGSNKLMNEIKDYLIEKINISKNNVYNKESVSFIMFSKPIDNKNFYNYIYNKAIIFLKRKREKFELKLDNTEATGLAPAP